MPTKRSKPLTVAQQDNIRQAIKANRIVENLHRYLDDERDPMTGVVPNYGEGKKMEAAKLLLAKCLPDLKAHEVKMEAKVEVESSKTVSALIEKLSGMRDD